MKIKCSSAHQDVQVVDLPAISRRLLAKKVGMSACQQPWSLCYVPKSAGW